MRHKILSLLLLSVISTIALANSRPTPSTLTSPYEIVTDVANNGMKTIDIYTTEKRPEELIKINDKVILNNGGYSVLSIRYFDDRSIIDTYFDKQLSESVSEKEKSELFTHYIADYKSTSNKLSINNGDTWTEIKNY